jgi:hypothetical protein
MMLIAHRINTIDKIINLADNLPIEFDIRDSNGKLIIQHDALKDGIFFEDFLPYIKNRFNIINIKSEGIEYKILDLLKQYEINNYFLLDCSIPMIYKLSKNGEKNIAIRFSEFETLESVLKWKHMVKWVWVDCFYSYILTKEVEKLLHEHGFRICLVSPELQGRENDITVYKNMLKDENIIVDAICTKYKNFDLWKL